MAEILEALESIKSFFTGGRPQGINDLAQPIEGADAPPLDLAQPIEGAKVPTDINDLAVPAEGQELTVVQKITSRFLGTDVDDPLEIPRIGALLTGQLTGGLLGSRTPTAPGVAGIVVNPATGAIAGSAIGTLMGAIAPETTIEMAERVGFVEKGTRARIGLSPNELRTLAEGELLLDLATGGTLGLLRLGGRAVGRGLTGANKETEELARLAAKEGVHLMPVQLGDRTIGRGYVAVLGRFPLFGTRITKTGKASEEAIQRALQDVPDRVGPVVGHSDLSVEIYKDANNLVRETNTAFSRRYEDLFNRADDLGVSVVPRETLGKADEILKNIGRETPVSATGKPTTPGKGIAKVKEFIENEVAVMRETAEGSTAYARQSVRQMDGFISKIDQEIASLEPAQRKFARQLLIQLRQAAQKDTLLNVRGSGAGDIARSLRELDGEFSHTMSSIFETATAKRFGTVERRGLRGVAFDKATRTPVDQLSRIVVKLDSPQAIEELHRLVQPETFNRVASQVLDDAVTEAMQRTESGARLFDVETFASRLGLDKATSKQAKTMEKMLDLSNSPLKKTDLQNLVETARVISTLEIPNVSSFIARRATIGGLRSIINAFIPGAMAVGGAAYAGGSVLATAVLLGGGRLVSSVISNPNTARALREVMGAEVSGVVKRKAFVQALRGGIEYMKEKGDFGVGKIAAETQTNLMEALDMVMDAIDRQVEEFGQ